MLEDGRFNEEGKERYFGKKSGILNRFVLGIKNRKGIQVGDSIPMGMFKYITSSINPLFSSAYGAEKSQMNAEKLGIYESAGKAFVKNILLGKQGSTNYDIHRSKGSTRIGSVLKGTGDNILNTLTLGSHTYKLNEQYGLEHSK